MHRRDREYAKTGTEQALNLFPALQSRLHDPAAQLSAVFPNIGKFGRFTIYVVTSGDEEDVTRLLADGHTGVLGTPGPSTIYWESGSTFPNFLYRCADDEWVAVGAIEPKFYAELLERLGLAPLSETVVVSAPAPLEPAPARIVRQAPLPPALTPVEISDILTLERSYV